MDTLHTEQYKGCTISIWYDWTASMERMLRDTGDVFACSEGDLDIQSEGAKAPRDMSLLELDTLCKTHDVGLGYIYSHSGVCLKPYTVVTRKDIREYVKYVQDYNKKETGSTATRAETMECDNEDSVRDLGTRLIAWHDARPDYIIATKKAKTGSELKAAYTRCDDYVQGNIYGFTITDDTTGDEIESCGGFEGDYDCAVEEAKQTIDADTGGEARAIVAAEKLLQKAATLLQGTIKK